MAMITSARATGGADHHQRSPGGEDHRRGPVDRGGRCDRAIDRVHGNDGGAFDFLGGDVLRQFEMHRTRALFHRDTERVPYRRGNGGRADDLARHLRQRLHRRDDIDDLEARLPGAHHRLLAGDEDHRPGSEMGVGRAGREVQCTGAQRGEAYAGPAREPSVRGGHERGGLFMARQHELDA
jgi:hypothetical protein